MRLISGLSVFLLIRSVYSLNCYISDGFEGMSKVQERVCVGSKCAKRSVVLDNGMVRIQKFCQSSDIRPGCRAAILWQGLPGEECVCDDGDFCNLCSRFLYTPAMLGFLFVSLYVMVTL